MTVTAHFTLPLAQYDLLTAYARKCAQPVAAALPLFLSRAAALETIQASALGPLLRAPDKGKKLAHYTFTLTDALRAELEALEDHEATLRTKLALVAAAVKYAAHPILRCILVPEAQPRYVDHLTYRAVMVDHPASRHGIVFGQGDLVIGAQLLKDSPADRWLARHAPAFSLSSESPP